MTGVVRPLANGSPAPPTTIEDEALALFHVLDKQVPGLRSTGIEAGAKTDLVSRIVVEVKGDATGVPSEWRGYAVVTKKHKVPG